MEEVKLELIKKAIDEKKGENITVYDVSTTSRICSYIVIASILNGRHGRSIAEELQEIQEKLGQRVRNFEGSDKDSWILVDLGDVIVHLFTEGERARVDLDTLIRKVNFLGAHNEKN